MKRRCAGVESGLTRSLDEARLRRGATTARLALVFTAADRCHTVL